MRLILLSFLVGLTMSSFGQDWQSVYNEAVAAYKAEQFEEAATKASLAVTLSSGLDLKSKTYSIQILTAACIEINQPDKGLSIVDQEIEGFKALDAAGTGYREALRKKGSLLLGAGKPLDAANVFHQLATIIGETPEKNSFAYYAALTDEADALLEGKRYAEAYARYAQCVPALKKIPDAGEDYLFGLFHYAGAAYALKEETASSLLQDFIALATSNGLTSIPEYADARKMLSAINSAKSDISGVMTEEDRARVMLKKALASQSKDALQARRDYALCEQVVRENNLLNGTSFSCYINFARFLYALKDYAEARQKLSQAREQAGKLFSTTSPEFGHIKMLEADLALHEGEQDKAAVLYRQALSNFENEKPEVLIKQVYWISDQLLDHKMFSELLAVLPGFISGPFFNTLPTPDKISIYRSQAAAYLGLRQHEQLVQQLRQRLPAEPNDDLKQMNLLLRAQAERDAGHWKESRTVLVLAEQQKSSGFLAAEIAFEFARISQQLGEFKEAEIQYRKSIDNLASSLSTTALTPQVYNSFATFYLELGNYPAAEKLLLQLLNSGDEQAEFYNSVRQNLAAIYEHTERYSEAKTLLVRALRSDRILLGDQHPDYAITLQNLAALYQKTGVLDSARIIYEQALAIDKVNSGEESLPYASKLGNLGSVYQASGDFNRARMMFERSLAVRKKILGSDHPDYAYNAYKLAFLFYRTRQPEQALPYFRAAASFYLKQIAEVFPVLSDFERTAFYNKIQEVIQGYEMFMVEHASMHKDLTGELLNFRLQTKALLLTSSVKVRNKILNSGNAELIHKFALWQHTKEELANLLASDLAEREANKYRIVEYSQKSDDLEKWLSLTADGFTSSYKSPMADWRAVQAVLKPGDAALEFLRVKLPHKDSVIYAALILRSEGNAPSLVVLPNGKSLEGRSYRRYLNGIKFQDLDEDSYRSYWEKIQRVLPDVRRLYLSPDGIFNKVNVMTLWNTDTRQYLIENLNVQFVTNLKDLLKTSSPQKGLQQAFLVGFPDYRLASAGESNSTKVSTRSRSLFSQVLEGGIADLPGTASEVSGIKKTLEANQWNVNLHLREEAREEIIKALKKADVVHIATHGFFITPDEEGAQHVAGGDLLNVENNSMLRSGLLLAGAEKHLIDKLTGQARNGSDDGVLTAYEVMNLTLDHTDLVVLSACETASGDVRNGEGVYGLQRAFMVAGANNLMMSLWKVDDTATQEMMVAFYEAWVRDNDKLSAFYKTQKKMKDKFTHPYYWGAFIMVGKP